MPNNKTLADIRDNARALSNYEDSEFVTDSELSSIANEAVSAYYDLVLSSRETYFRSVFSFSMAGGIGANTVELPSDLYKIQALDWNPNTSSVMTVPTLPSFRERNTIGRRSYDWAAGTLTVYPPNAANGSYELFYTPYAPILADTVTVITSYPTVTISIVASTDAVDGLTDNWFFTNGEFDSSYVGRFLEITGAINPGNNGLHLISAVTDAQNITTTATGGSELFTADVTAAVFTGPIDDVSLGGDALWIFNQADFDGIEAGATITVAGSDTSDGTYTVVSGSGNSVITSIGALSDPESFLPGVTVTYQPPGTIYRLPDTLQSGALWIELFVADSILDKAEQDSTSIKMRLAQQTKRIQDAFRWKQDEPKQVPLVRRGYGTNGWGW